LGIHKYKAIKIGNKLNAFLHVVISRLYDRHGFGSRQSTKKFLKKISKLNIDVIHLHNIHGYYINIELLFEFIKNNQIPVVWTFHSCWAFTGHCSHFDYIGCEKWKTGCHDCPQIRSYPKSFFIDNSKINYLDKKRIFNDVNSLYIVTPSKWLEVLTKQSFLNHYNVLTINNGIDLSVFKYGSSNLKKMLKIESKFVILGISSSWDDTKGLDYFIKLSSMIAKDQVILIVGLDKKSKINLPENIISYGKTNNSYELVEIYRGVDVLVNPTLQDTFPTINLEALACGTPVVTFNTGGSPESINNSVGLVVEKGNIEALYRGLNVIKTKGKSYYSVNCINHARINFNKYDRFNEYLKLYEELHNSKK
jgi:glycosyltransferase involved in cell wall biosynthesis